MRVSVDHRSKNPALYKFKYLHGCGVIRFPRKAWEKLSPMEQLSHIMPSLVDMSEMIESLTPEEKLTASLKKRKKR